MNKLTRIGLLVAILSLAVMPSLPAAADPIVYRTNRVFEATQTSIGTATVYNIVNAATGLTGIIIGQYAITTNDQWATEREGVSWGQTSTTQAWHNITNSPGALPIGTYTNIFDDPGWIKGVKTVTLNGDTTYGAYMWWLQNTLEFTTPGSTYWTNAGRTYLLENVLVGTLGDYAPGTVYTNVFPQMDDPDATNWPGCPFLTSEMPASSETVKYSFDTTAYYRLAYPSVDLSIDGVADDKEEAEGKVIVQRNDGNNACRAKIVLKGVQPTNWPGNVVIAKNNLRVSLFDAKTNGNEIVFDGTDNVFAWRTLPKALWVQGNEASAAMRDASLELHAEGFTNCRDKVNFTVLWVDSITRRFADASPQYGSVDTNDYIGDDMASDDNDKKAFLAADCTYPPLAHLGLNKYKECPDVRLGWGYEVRGTVHPADYAAPSPYCEPYGWRQDVACKVYKNGDKVVDEPYPFPGFDSDPDWLPWSSNDGPVYDFKDAETSTNGSIYFLDAPGLRWDAPAEQTSVKTGHSRDLTRKLNAPGERILWGR